MSLVSFLFFSRVFLQSQGGREEFRVESIRPYKGYYILKLEGIDSLQRAQELVGQEVLIPEEELPHLKEDYYYHFQILGCRVITKNGEEIGIVEDLVTIPDNDLLVIHGEKSQTFIPFSKDICVQVNLDKKEIVIDPPEGLLDLNEI